MCLQRWGGDARVSVARSDVEVGEKRTRASGEAEKNIERMDKEIDVWCWNGRVILRWVKGVSDILPSIRRLDRSIVEIFFTLYLKV